MNLQHWIVAVRQKLTTSALPPNPPVNGSLLLGQRDRAADAADTALGLLRTLIAHATQQRGTLARAEDQVHQLAALARERNSSLELTRDALERSKLLALNAGLEGARLGDAAGRAVLAIAEEVRSMANRALQSLEEHLGALTELQSFHEKLGTTIRQAAENSSAVLDNASRAEQAQLESRRLLGDLGTELQRSLGADPEVARVAGQAATHLEGLLSTLHRLPSAAQRARLIDALRPSLQPLLHVLSEATRIDPDHP